MTEDFGRNCLIARRLLERGVRFVQVWSGADNGFPRRNWDSHEDLARDHGDMGRSMDQPAAALIKDLKARGLLDDTIVIWTTEFGRMPCSQGSKGRDHNPFAFTTLAGRRRHQAAARRYGAERRVVVQGRRQPDLLLRPARHRAAPAGHRPRAADLPPQRHRPPPDRRARPRDSRDHRLTIGPPAGKGIRMTSPTGAGPRFAAAVSTLEDTASAVAEACRLVKQAFGKSLETDIDLVAVFASPDHGPRFETIGKVISAELAAKCTIGCTGESIVCNAREYESQPALAVWAAPFAGGVARADAARL